MLIVFTELLKACNSDLSWTEVRHFFAVKEIFDCELIHDLEEKNSLKKNCRLSQETMPEMTVIQVGSTIQRSRVKS